MLFYRYHVVHTLMRDFLYFRKKILPWHQDLHSSFLRFRHYPFDRLFSRPGLEIPSEQRNGEKVGCIIEDLFSLLRRVQRGSIALLFFFSSGGRKTMRNRCCGNFRGAQNATRYYRERENKKNQNIFSSYILWEVVVSRLPAISLRYN